MLAVDLEKIDMVEAILQTKVDVNVQDQVMEIETAIDCKQCRSVCPLFEGTRKGSVRAAESNGWAWVDQSFE